MTEVTLSFDAGTIRVEGGDAIELPDLDLESDPRSRTGRLPAFQYAQLVDRLRQQDVAVDDRVFDLPDIELDSPYQLREYQAKALAAWQDSDSRGVLELPTGSGKTVIGIAAIEALGTPGHAERRSREKVAAYPTRTEKQRRRKRMLAEWGEIAYAKRLAFDLTQAKYHGLLNEADLPGYHQALDYLASVDFRRFLLDPDVMAIYAAQVANLVYYLEELGVTDLREEVITAFRHQYPPWRDARLSTAEYRNKIYGMTHFVIAASDYYQRPVSAEEFRWVLDAFAAGLERILADTKEDIYTEVGISFLLAGEEGHPAVTRLRDALVQAYDREARMVPSEQGGTDLAQGEHRNVLAIMLLDWPERLYPGPELSFGSPSNSIRDLSCIECSATCASSS